MRISRLRRAVATLACATAVVAGATACSPAQPEKTPTPTKTAIFASEDEALQAAVDVFQQFNAVVDLVDSSGEENLVEMKGVATDSFYEEFSEATSLEDEGKHASGNSTFENAELVSLEQSTEGAELAIALCRDLSNVRIFDSEDEDVTADSRQLDRVPLEVNFVWDSDEGQLLIADLSTWQDTEVC